MNNLVFVDCEAYGGCPGLGQLTEIGAVWYIPAHDSAKWPKFYGDLRVTGAVVKEEDHHSTAESVFAAFGEWLRPKGHDGSRPVFVSDNPAFDWQWVNDGFLRYLGANPFGHSARRISDFYAGLRRDFRKTQEWKQWRSTQHDHNPVHDALGNAEAFHYMMTHLQEIV